MIKSSLHELIYWFNNAFNPQGTHNDGTTRYNVFLLFKKKTVVSIHHKENC